MVNEARVVVMFWYLFYVLIRYCETIVGTREVTSTGIIMLAECALLVHLFDKDKEFKLSSQGQHFSSKGNFG